MWDERHLKALLRLPRYPQTLLEQASWGRWLHERGGAAAVRDSLRQAPLQPLQSQLLGLILNDPSGTSLRRAAALHVSVSTYFRCLNGLVDSLLEYLNAPAPPDARSAAPPTNLPIPLAPLVGAEAALQHIVHVLTGPQVRLVTLTGTGGIGKTRLAIQAARRVMADAETRRDVSEGVFWVDLAPLRAPELILVEIARVLNLTERSGYPTLELLQRELRERRLLLLLDNFEHLLPAAPMLTALLQRTAHLKLLITSRAALNLAGEQRLAVPPLDLPGLDPLPAVEALSGYSAIQFFVQRARAVDEAFALTPENAPAVVQLCAALDGLPLALEMAAGRVNHLSPQTMLTLLGQRLQVLAGGRDAAPRHQTLRSLIDWSYQLLDVNVQQAFRRLAVFANGWTLEAMAAVCTPAGRDVKPALEILAALVNHSVIVQQPGEAAMRFGMLETLREFAQEKLAASGEESFIRQRHAAYYLSSVEAWAHLNVEPSLPVAQLAHDYLNLRLALQWAVEQRQPDLASDLAIALWHYWTTHGSPNEGRYWLARVLAIQPPAHTPKRTPVLMAMGEVALYQNEFQQAQALYEEVAALAREFNNRHDLGVALQGLGEIAQFRGDYARARSLYSESLALYRELENTRGTAWALDRLGNLALEQGALAEASAFFAESLGIFEAQSYPDGIAHARAKLGLIAFEERRYADAAQCFEDSLGCLRPMHPDWHYVWLIDYLGQAVLGLGDLQRAAGLFRQSLKIHSEGKAAQGIAYSLHGLAAVALAEGQGRRAVRWLGGVQLIFDRAPPPPARRRQLEASVLRGQSLLDPPAFRAAWREGQALSLDQIVAEALGGSG